MGASGHEAPQRSNSYSSRSFTLTGPFETVIAKLSFFFVANYALSFVSLFVLRRREPTADRPYRAWGHPVTTGLALLSSVAFLVGAVVMDLRNSIYALALLALSVPVYAIVKLAGRAEPVAED